MPVWGPSSPGMFGIHPAMQRGGHLHPCMYKQNLYLCTHDRGVWLCTEGISLKLKVV